MSVGLSVATDYSEERTFTYKDASGKSTTETVPKEELRTVGLKGNKKDDITENKLRKEQGLKERRLINAK